MPCGHGESTSPHTKICIVFQCQGVGHIPPYQSSYTMLWWVPPQGACTPLAHALLVVAANSEQQQCIKKGWCQYIQQHLLPAAAAEAAAAAAAAAIAAAIAAAAAAAVAFALPKIYMCMHAAHITLHAQRAEPQLLCSYRL